MLLDDLKTALVTATLVTDANGAAPADWQIYLGYFHEGPNRAVCLYESPGPAPLEAWAVDYPDFQVVVRGNADDYQAVRSKLDAIFKFLQGGEVAIGAAYVFVYAKHSGPIPMGQDTNRRPSLAMNFRCMKQRT